MAPPVQGLELNLAALSGITGSISIACWIVVFSPQIIENFRRSSAEGLSIVFVIIWLVGDIFNIIGGIMQHILPTMIILAVYYTLADIVLLLQCFYYRGFTLRDEVPKPAAEEESQHEANDTTPLLQNNSSNGSPTIKPRSNSPMGSFPESIRRSSSPGSFRERLASADAAHLSPAHPIHPQRDASDAVESPSKPSKKRSLIKSLLFNLTTVLVVCAAGALGWYLSGGSKDDSSSNPGHEKYHDIDNDPTLQFNTLGQVFGYICAVLYLGSRLPQLLLNYRRKSTEGISMLFFLFACIGNLTYVISVVAYEPVCRRPDACMPDEAKEIYLRYFAVNFSWLLGSFGTLLLDAGVFVQYFMYREDRPVA